MSRQILGLYRGVHKYKTDMLWALFIWIVFSFMFALTPFALIWGSSYFRGEAVQIVSSLAVRGDLSLICIDLDERGYPDLESELSFRGTDANHPSTNLQLKVQKLEEQVTMLTHMMTENQLHHTVGFPWIRESAIPHNREIQIPYSGLESFDPINAELFFKQSLNKTDLAGIAGSGKYSNTDIEYKLGCSLEPSNSVPARHLPQPEKIFEWIEENNH